MADSNHLSARLGEVADDDPFAELTRIMGQGSFIRPRSVDEDVEALGLDLEKELLGDFTESDFADADFAQPDFADQEPETETAAPEASRDAADLFGDADFASELFKGAGLDGFEQALASEPAFEGNVFAEPEVDAPAPEPSFEPEPFDPAHSAAPSGGSDIFGTQAPSLDEIFDGFDEPEQTSHEDAHYGQSDLGQADFRQADFEPSDFGQADVEQADFAQPDVDQPGQFAETHSPFDLSGATFRLRGYADPLPSGDEFFPDELAAYEPQQEAEDVSALNDGDVFAASDFRIEEELEKALDLTSEWDPGTGQPEGEVRGDDAWLLQMNAQPEDNPQPLANDASDWLGDFSGVGQEVPTPEQQDPANEAQFWATSGESWAQDDEPVAALSEDDLAVEPAEPGFDAGFGGVPTFDGPPEIETIEIREKAVAITESLDLPHVPYREEVKPAAQLDDIEELLSGAFGTMDHGSQQAGEWAAPEQAGNGENGDENDQDDFDELLTAGLAAASAAALARDNYAQADPDFAYDGWNDGQGYDQSPRPMPGTPPPAQENSGFFNRRNSTILALLASVAVIGIGAVFAFTPIGGGGSGETVVIKADASPVKVKPENPGGTTIPNQDSQVYRQVAGETPETAGQTQLVSTAEEPVLLPSPPAPVEEDVVAEAVEFSEAVAADAAEKSEERLVSAGEESGQTEAYTMLTPRRVRSYVVRPDGTMVEREVEAPVQTAAAEPSQVDDASPGLPGVQADRVSVNVSGNANPSLDAGLVEGQQVPPLGAAPEGVVDEAPGLAQQMPRSAPIPASRPTNVARANTPATAPAPAAPAAAVPTQVAAAQSAAPTASAAASGWSVQIASQPTLEAAQQSYQSLAQRHGSMLQGKGVNIVKAEVQGRGTYYRVRIPASTKNDAIALCESLKASGGSCFVSQ